MITVTGLTKHYGDRTAVDDLTFTVAAGRVTGFVGPNGAGKSTTMRMMVGLTRPDAGEVRYDGVRYTDLRHPARLVGTVLDPRCMHPGHTARNHLRAMAATERHPRRPRRRGPRRGRPRIGRRPAHRRLLPRHAPAARPRRRPPRRPAGPAARRAVERPRPRRHPLAAQPPHRLRPPAAAPCSCRATSSASSAMFADDLVVVGGGKLLAADTVESITARQAATVVAETPRPADLARVLAGPQVTVEADRRPARHPRRHQGHRVPDSPSSTASASSSSARPPRRSRTPSST